MPEFGNAFSGRAAKRVLTHSELVRSIRFMIAAEYEAIQLYEQLAESTDNALARKVLMDITHEEMEHVGEFKRLLRELAPEDESFYREGEEETEEAIAELGEAAGKSCCKEQDAAACCAAAEAEGQKHSCCSSSAGGKNPAEMPQKACHGNDAKTCAGEDSK